MSFMLFCFLKTWFVDSVALLYLLLQVLLWMCKEIISHVSLFLLIDSNLQHLWQKLQDKMVSDHLNLLLFDFDMSYLAIVVSCSFPVALIRVFQRYQTTLTCFTLLLSLRSKSTSLSVWSHHLILLFWYLPLITDILDFVVIYIYDSCLLSLCLLVNFWSTVQDVKCPGCFQM